MVETQAISDLAWHLLNFDAVVVDLTGPGFRTPRQDRSQALEDLKREKYEKGSVFLTGLLGMAWIMGR
ncbi:hypothetical protein VTI28DRAFT_7399 [Corynascus sepedonium]